jgi:hypothetical protein
MMLNDRPAEQTVLAKEILLKKLTVRESEALARRVAQDRVSAKHKIDPEILALERSLTERLGTRVTIEPREVGGRLVISFFNASDLQALLDAMQIEREKEMASVFDGIQEAGKNEALEVEDPTVAGVVPDPSLPQPEPSPVTTIPTEALPVSPVTPPAQEDDSRLYSIRDFSI